MGSTPESPSPPAPKAATSSAAANSAGSLPTDQRSPGKLLAAGRKARELTIDEVGDALNLAAQTVRLLEADDFDALPAAAFTQGYIRNYAKHVGLDADVVVAAYQEKAGKPAVSWESPRTAAGLAELVQRHPGVLITAVVAAVVLLIVVTLVLVWPEDEAEPVVADPLGIEQGAFVDPRGDGDGPDESPVRSDAADATRRGATAAAERDGSSSGSARDSSREQRYDTPAVQTDGTGSAFDRDAIDPDDPLAHLPLAKTYPAGSVGTSDNIEADDSSDSTGVDSGAADANYRLAVNRRLTPEGTDQVRVEVTEDCWVAISSVQGNSLFETLARPGQTLNLTGAGPFRVKLGYTPGIELFFNDNPVLLEPYTRNDVASLVIGQ